MIQNSLDAVSNGVWLEKKPWSHYIIFNISSEGAIYRISYLIYIQYIFTRKISCQRKVFSQIKIVHFVRFQIQMSFCWPTDEYTRTYYSILHYSFNSPFSIKYIWIKFIISCQRRHSFIYLRFQILATHTRKWYRY